MGGSPFVDVLEPLGYRADKMALDLLKMPWHINDKSTSQSLHFLS
jgi:hypothetical protein